MKWLALFLFLICFCARADLLLTPRQTQLTWNFSTNKFNTNAVFIVYATNALAPVSASWPVLTNFPASQNIVSTNGANFVYSIPVQLAYPALFFTVSVSNQSGVLWCVNPPFCPSDPLLQIGDLIGAVVH